MRMRVAFASSAEGDHERAQRQRLDLPDVGRSHHVDGDERRRADGQLGQSGLMRVIGGLLAIAALGVTHARLPMWASDRALWGHAVRMTPTLPRPNANYAAALLVEGEPAAVLYSLRAAQFSADPRLAVPLTEGMHEHHLTVPLLGVAVAFGRWMET